MSTFVQLLAAGAAVVGLARPSNMPAVGEDTMACAITVDYSLNNVVRQSYVKEFEVDPLTPFSDDFSTATRFKFFDAWMTREAGVPVVNVSFFADVSVFNAVDFSTTLKVRDERHGETTSSVSTFYQGGATPGVHRTAYSLTCRRAAN